MWQDVTVCDSKWQDVTECVRMWQDVTGCVNKFVTRWTFCEFQFDMTSFSDRRPRAATNELVYALSTLGSDLGSWRQYNSSWCFETVFLANLFRVQYWSEIAKLPATTPLLMSQPIPEDPSEKWLMPQNVMLCRWTSKHVYRMLARLFPGDKVRFGTLCNRIQPCRVADQRLKRVIDLVMEITTSSQACQRNAWLWNSRKLIVPLIRMCWSWSAL